MTEQSPVTRPEFVSFTVADGALGALHWAGIPGAPSVLAVHGRTGNAWHFDPVAHRLAGGADLVSLDLRGRGRSVNHAGPFGLRAHADDIAHVARTLGGRVTLVGHSMGASACLLAAAHNPELFVDVVVVDGAVPPPVDPDRSIDDQLLEMLGPTAERLRTVWPDRVSYLAMWSQHPAFRDGIGRDLERTLLADLVPTDGGFRSAVNESAVLIDGADLLVDDELRRILIDRRAETTVVRAQFGPDGSASPLISDAMIASMPQHRWVPSPGTNHSTVLLGPTGAAVVADEVRRTTAGASATS